MRYFLILPLIAITLGCGVKPPVVGRQDPFPASQIHFADKDIRGNTAVGTPVATRDDAGNLLEVTVPIRAATDLRLYIEYRVTFFDANHQPLGNSTTWFPKTLEPNIPDSITVKSVTPLARDFQVDFRYGT